MTDDALPEDRLREAIRDIVIDAWNSETPNEALSAVDRLDLSAASRPAPEPSREEWIDHGIAAAQDLSDAYHEGRDGPGGLTVATIRSHIDAIWTAFEALRESASRPAPDTRTEALERALAQALDRFDTIGDHLKPDATDDDRHAVAQAWWFGSEEVRSALSPSKGSDPA